MCQLSLIKFLEVFHVILGHKDNKEAYQLTQGNRAMSHFNLDSKEVCQ